MVYGNVKKFSVPPTSYKMPGEVFQDIFKVKAVDTTAAGDTFTGYFLMAQEKGFSAEQCLSIAAQASAIAVSRKGASVSVPVWAELQMDL